MKPSSVFLTVCIATLLLTGCSTPTPTPPPLSLSGSIPNSEPTNTACITITVSKETLKVGETIQVQGTLLNVTKPTYLGVEIKDKSAEDSSMMANLLMTPIQPADVSPIVKMNGGSYADGKATVELKGISSGETSINFFASAEDFCGTPLGSGVSPKVKITVTP